MRYSIANTTIEQVRAVGATNIKQPSSVPTIFATLTEAQAQRLRDLGAIVTRVSDVRASVMPPVPVAAVPTYTVQELIEAVGFEELRAMMTPLLYGEGTNAAVLDTGIRETHEDIAGHIIYSKNFTSSPMRDGVDHGTGCASIILAVAPKAGILNMKVLDDEGRGTEEEVVMAIDECISLHNTRPEVAPSGINLSLGAPDTGDPNSPLRVACRAAMERGIWIIAAAGNGGPNPTTITSPACERYVFAVGSLSLEPFTVSDFSSRGPTVEGIVKPDLSAFGEDIIVASSESDTATAAKSGTSFPTPFCTGAALLHHEAIVRYGGVRYIGEAPLPGSLTEIVAETLSIQVTMNDYLPRICVKPVGVPAGKDNDYGYGVPFGPLVREVLGAIPAAVDFSSLISAVFMIGMMGVMMKVMK